MTSPRILAALFLLLLLVTSAFCDSRAIPAPDGIKRIEYEFFDDSESGIDNTLRAKLIRADKTVWSFDAKGRVIVFSWSPDSRYLLYGVVLAGRDMELYCLDTDAAHPQEHDLHLDSIAKRVEGAVPERPSGSLAPRSQIDFEKVQWLSNSRCTLSYFYRFDRKAGDAKLDLDLAARPPKLEIVRVTSVPK
jgi:hypothetical protein